MFVRISFKRFEVVNFLLTFIWNSGETVRRREQVLPYSKISKINSNFKAVGKKYYRIDYKSAPAKNIRGILWGTSLREAKDNKFCYTRFLLLPTG